MIRTSKHILKYSNISKREDIANLIVEYRLLVKNIINYIWVNGYKSLNISKNKLSCPSLLDSTFLNKFKTIYTERLKQAAGKQALQMISSAIEKKTLEIKTASKRKTRY